MVRCPITARIPWHRPPILMDYVSIGLVKFSNTLAWPCFSLPFLPPCPGYGLHVSSFFQSYCLSNFLTSMSHMHGAVTWIMQLIYTGHASADLTLHHSSVDSIYPPLALSDCLYLSTMQEHQVHEQQQYAFKNVSCFCTVIEPMPTRKWRMSAYWMFLCAQSTPPTH